MMDVTNSSEINQLAEKYGGKILMYTEYPPKSFWRANYSNDDHENAWIDFLRDHPSAPVLLYLHMPYCYTRCYFCTCRVEIAKKYEDIRDYMAILFQEIELLGKLFDKIGSRPNIKEIHLGGGSPTLIGFQEFEELMVGLKTIVNLDDICEFSIEIDPRRVNPSKMRYYSQKGINRVSFGVQDFDLDVQRVVNRIQPPYLTEELMTPDIRKLFSNGINFDIICGLPNQTLQSMRTTMNRVVALNPDRICLNYLDLAFKFNPHQIMMPDGRIPGSINRKLLFAEAAEILFSAGYIQAGYDHFARPTDAVAKAMNEKSMIWNSFGATPGRCSDIIGLGVHSYSRLGPENYYQNCYELKTYISRLRDENKFPVFRGMRLNRDDIVRRAVIHGLRNYFEISFCDIETQYNIVFKEYFHRELECLDALVSDGMVEPIADSVSITPMGRLFANVVCKVFDAYSA